MRGKQIAKLILGMVLLAALAGLAGLAVLRAKDGPDVLAEADLKDGRILRIEALTYGKEHQIGDESALFTRLRPWLPGSLRDFLSPRVPRSAISREAPGLVVWVHAIDPVSGTNVDCQGVRMEFVSDQGDLFGAEDLYWSGFNKFWRVGHAFDAFPRDEKSLKLRLTSWKSEESVELELINPWHTRGKDWTGEPLPARETVEDYEIVLAGLKAISTEEKYYETPSAYLAPELELWHHGERATNGWTEEWEAEDPFGNRGQKLGLHQPVLKYSITYHPSATNLEAAVVLTNTPYFPVNLQSNIWWNIPALADICSLVILGVFPPGMHIFSEGEYLTNPPVSLAPVQGGAPSGWVSTTRQATPLRREVYGGHYTDVPTLYVQVLGGPLTERIGMRLRDESGGTWLAQPEEQSSPVEILAFLLHVPEGVQFLSAELVLLPAVEAEFLVATGVDDHAPAESEVQPDESL